MAKDISIPLRPKYKRYNLVAKEMDCLVWYVISGCKREEAYKIFVRPDLATSPKMLKEYTNQMFSSVDARNFMSDYKKTLEGAANSEFPETTDEHREKRKKQAQQNIEDKTLDIMLSDLDTVEKLDAAVRVADRVGALADKEQKIEEPRIYLPERCVKCRNRIFVEEGIEKGDIIDLCACCKALSYARDRGFVYDSTNLYELPHDDLGQECDNDEQDQ